MRWSHHIILFSLLIAASIASEPRFGFGSLKERFRRAVAVSRPLHRARRVAVVGFRLPYKSNIEVVLGVNLPTQTEPKYGGKLQLGLASKRSLPDYMVDEKADPTLDELLGVEDRRKRDVEERRTIYDGIVSSLDSKGLPGKSCLLRTICEVQEAPFHFGIMGDFINLLFTPSLIADQADASDVDHLMDYLKAEDAGRLEGGCHKRYAGCSQSLFELVPLISRKVFHV